MLTSDHHVIIVGGGLAGWRTVESLRREGFAGALTLISDEPYAPYDRPPLSKHVLSGKWTIEQTQLASDDAIAALDVTMRLGTAATHLDVAGASVTLASGERVTGTHVVIATGVRARTLGYSATGLHYVRSRDDATALRDRLEQLAAGDQVAIIGGGFIGAEVATAVRGRGLTPIVLEAAERPLGSVLGDTVARWLEPLAAEADVVLRTAQKITDVTNDGTRFVLQFATGEALSVAAVVVGVGSVANVDWLVGADLVIDNGVVVNEHLLAHPHVAAIGDVARFTWSSALGDAAVRIEHWQVASDHATALANYWVHGVASPPMVPYFWSDQYGKKIQLLGHPHADHAVTLVAGSLDEGRWLAAYHHEGRVTGLLSLSQPRWLMVSKVALDEHWTVEELVSRAPWGA